MNWASKKLQDERERETKMKILLIEDDMEISDMLKKFLETEHCGLVCYKCRNKRLVVEET